MIFILQIWINDWFAYINTVQTCLVDVNHDIIIAKLRDLLKSAKTKLHELL